MCTSIHYKTSRRGSKLRLSITVLQWAGIAQSVQRLATGWTVRGSNPADREGDEIFRARLDWPCGIPRLPYNGYWVFLLQVKRLGNGVNHPPPSSAEVKERVDISLLPLWAFIACSRASFTILYNTLLLITVLCVSRSSVSCKVKVCGRKY